MIVFEDSLYTEHEIRIYFEDPDFISQNQTELEDIYMNWQVSPISNTNKVVLQEVVEDNIPIQGINSDNNNNFYYYKKLYVQQLASNFNGPYAASVYNDNLDIDPYQLDIFVYQQNDYPDSFPPTTTSIIDLNSYNDYSWPSDEELICTDQELAQGYYDFGAGACNISNFFVDGYYYALNNQDSHYDNADDCYANELNDMPEDSCIYKQNSYYRLPFSRVPSIDEVESDKLLLSWNETNDADIYDSEDEIDLEIFYRIELIDVSKNRVIVLKDKISGQDVCMDGECEYDINLEEIFFSYNMDLKYYDSCGIFNNELSLNDTSSIALDLTGQTEYMWQISANNDWCDYNGTDPSQIFISDISYDTNFYIDLVPPRATITIMQNNFVSDLLDIYITFDEVIDIFTSELFITHGDATSSSGFTSESNNNIYHLTELIPGQGLITIDVESWDLVGNGILSSKEVVYEQILSSQYMEVFSPSRNLMLQFEEDDIDGNASILIQEKDLEITNEIINTDFQRVSNIYEISSVDMNILEDISIEISIPERYLDLDYWKFRVYSIDENSIIEDITSWSKESMAIGSLTELKDVALYYDAQAELELPNDIDLIGNYPNPFNPSTRIYYIVKQNSSSVKISILDLLGREVRVLYDGINDIGYHELSWDGNSRDGTPLGSGIYFINASINQDHKYRKVMKLK